MNVKSILMALTAVLFVGFSAQAKTEKKQSAAQIINDAQMAAQNLGYYAGYLLIDDVLTTRDATSVLRLTEEGRAKMIADRDAASAVIDAAAKKLNSTGMCQSFFADVIKDAQASGFLNTTVVASQSIKAPQSEQDSWLAASRIFSQGRNQNVMKLALQYCK